MHSSIALFGSLEICCICIVYVFFFKQKTAYEMRISDWSSDVCSSDLKSCATHAEKVGKRRRNNGFADTSENLIDQQIDLGVWSQRVMVRLDVKDLGL